MYTHKTEKERLSEGLPVSFLLLGVFRRTPPARPNQTGQAKCVGEKSSVFLYRHRVDILL